MALTSFIPTIWSANILANLNKNHVYGQPGLVNRDYEGEISAYGDTVKIFSFGRIATFDYTRNVDLPAPELLDVAEQSLTVDQARAFHFAVDDVDKAQIRSNLMTNATAEAAYSLAGDADSYLAGLYVGGTPPLGTAAAPIELTPADAYDLMVDLGIKIKGQRVTGPRTAVVPEWFPGLVAKDPRFNKESGVLANGYAGRVGETTIVESANVPTLTDATAGTSWVLQLSTPAARTFVEQVVQTQAYRPESRFSDAVKGLHVYGGKVVRPEALVSAVVKPAAGTFRDGVVS